MTRTRRFVVFPLVTVLLAILTVLAAPPSAANTAYAGSNFGIVTNAAGSPVRIDCNYGRGPYHTLYELRDPRPSSSWRYCSDTDRFKSIGDLRCMTYHGPQYRDGLYRLRANVWRKVSGLAVVVVYAYTYQRCGKQPFFNLT